MLHVLLGPTASGKERLALALAGRMGAEIVSVDSMKVYRGLDVGTAKPSPADRARVRHHGLDVADPGETWSAARWAAMAAEAVAGVRARGRAVILSGGTALYLVALLRGMSAAPGRDAATRARLEAEADALGTGALWERLARLDPASGRLVHPRDRRRLVRALEVWELTGRPPSAWRRQWPEPGTPGPLGGGGDLYPCRMARLAWPRPALLRRAAARAGRMRAAGLLAEARGVWERREALAAAPLQAVAYKEFFPFFRGEEGEEAAWERLRRGTARLAKAQETWFRRFPAVAVPCGPGEGHGGGRDGDLGGEPEADPALADRVLRAWEAGP